MKKFKVGDRVAFKSECEDAELEEDIFSGVKKRFLDRHTPPYTVTSVKCGGYVKINGYNIAQYKNEWLRVVGNEEVF